MATNPSYQEYDLVTPDSMDEGTSFPEPEEALAEVKPPTQTTPDIEVEVEDDTPEEDRGRTPLPKPLLEELEADELDAYDDKIKARLKQMRKVWHDERREKEAAIRERQAAIEYTQRIMSENERLRNTLSTGGQEYANVLQLAARQQVEAATRAYKDAYEQGDSERIVEAQNALQQANFRLMQAQNFRVPTLHNSQNQVQPQQRPVQQPVQPPKPVERALDPKLVAWQERNSWYGTDHEMTAAALGLHEKLRLEGEVEVGSDEYYAVLDKTMRRRFPEHFGTQPTQDKGTKPNTVVAPAVRSTAPRRVRLTKSQVDLARRLGITPEQYALEMRKMESGNE